LLGSRPSIKTDGIQSAFIKKEVQVILLRRSLSMLYTIAIILVIFWLLGFSFHVAGGLIHILLVLAVIAIIFKVVTGRAP
jgi:uncharacterized protein DUF5670